MKLKLTNNDDISVQDGKLRVMCEGSEYFFAKEEIEAAMILTTDLGPVYDDMCLAVRIDEETAVFMMSEHPCFKPFLFDELKTLIDVDYGQVTEAALCIENGMFFIYRRTAEGNNL